MHFWNLCIFTIAIMLLMSSPARALVSEDINYTAVIVQSKKFQRLDEKVDYLLQAGQFFIRQEKYMQARKVAEYVLQDLGTDSDAAKEIIYTSLRKGNNR